jgi:hypothetical protein
MKDKRCLHNVFGSLRFPTLESEWAVLTAAELL